MNILGPDSLVFGVDDVAACIQFFTDYGLTPVGVSDSGGRFEAVDGTSIVIARRDDTFLPAPMETGTMLRKTIYGVADRQALDAIADELGRDREVKRLADGSIEACDDMGFVLGFQIRCGARSTCRAKRRIRPAASRPVVPTSWARARMRSTGR